MRFLNRLKLAYRAITLPQLDQLMDLAIFGGPTHSGQSVGNATAMNFAAWHSIVKIISEDLAKLPLNLFERTGQDRRLASGHPVYTLLRTRPNPASTPFHFRQTLIAHQINWGNGYAQIIRDTNGTPRELWPLDPSRMEVGLKDRERVYLYRASDGQTVPLTQREVFHVYGLGFDGIQGYNPITHALKEAIGSALAAEKYGADFFATPTPMLLLKMAGQTKEEEKKAIVAKWIDAMKTRKRVGVLDNGLEVAQPIERMPNDAAQFLGTRKFGVEELARNARMPMHKLQSLDRATFSNIEHQALEYVTDCLMAYAVNFEETIGFSLLANPQRYFARHNFYALLRGDSKSQAEFFRTLWNIGVYSVNDIRALLEENSIGPDGDRRFVPMNMVPVDRVDDFVASKAIPLARSIGAEKSAAMLAPPN